MKQAIAFYTGVLDFTFRHPNSTEDDGVVDLVNEGIAIQLTSHESESLLGSVIHIEVENVDLLFKRYLERGLDISEQKDSPVHQGPTDQSWGVREFYVTDIDGNTLRFRQPFKLPRANYMNGWPYIEGRRMNLPVKDVTAAAPFYINFMNFRELSRNDHPVPTIIFERDAIRIAIAENGGDPSQEGCFFEVDNVETALKELQLNGLKSELADIGMHQHGETNWKLFYVVAPDGLCYAIGQKQTGKT